MKPPSLETWLWHGLRLELPADWEVLEFAKNARRGRLLFADAEDFRLEASWQEAPTAPEWGRLLADYAGRLREAGWEVDEPASRGAWRTLGARGRRQETWRAIRHFPMAGRLLELVGNVERGADPGTACAAVLAGAEWVEPPAAVRRWRAFGLEVQLTEPLALNTCEVWPAHVRLEFGAADERVTCERRGLVPRWLPAGGVGRWLREGLADDARVQSEESTHDEAGTGLRLKADERQGRGLFGTLRRRPVTAQAFRCPHCDRVVRWFVRRAREVAEDTELPAVRCVHRPGIA
jgi:hypothetical protein